MLLSEIDIYLSFIWTVLGRPILCIFGFYFFLCLFSIKSMVSFGWMIDCSLNWSICPNDANSGTRTFLSLINNWIELLLTVSKLDYWVTEMLVSSLRVLEERPIRFISSSLYRVSWSMLYEPLTIFSAASGLNFVPSLSKSFLIC